MSANFKIIPSPFPLLQEDQNFPTVTYGCENNRLWNMHYLHGSCEEALGISEKLLLSGDVHIGNLITDDEFDKCWDAVQLALAKKLPYQLSYHIHLPNGDQKILFDLGEGVFTKAGKFIELRGFITDITPKKTNDIKDCIREIHQVAAQLQLIQENERNIINEREIEIAIYHCQGMTMKEIGLKLKISHRTVEAYLNRIKMKLGCHTKTQLRNIFLMSTHGKKLIVTNF